MNIYSREIPQWRAILHGIIEGVMLLAAAIAVIADNWQLAGILGFNVLLWKIKDARDQVMDALKGDGYSKRRPL